MDTEVEQSKSANKYGRPLLGQRGPHNHLFAGAGIFTAGGLVAFTVEALVLAALVALAWGVSSTFGFGLTILLVSSNSGCFSRICCFCTPASEPSEVYGL